MRPHPEPSCTSPRTRRSSSSYRTWRPPRATRSRWSGPSTPIVPRTSGFRGPAPAPWPGPPPRPATRTGGDPGSHRLHRWGSAGSGCGLRSTVADVAGLTPTPTSHRRATSGSPEDPPLAPSCPPEPVGDPHRHAAGPEPAVDGPSRITPRRLRIRRRSSAMRIPSPHPPEPAPARCPATKHPSPVGREPLSWAEPGRPSAAPATVPPQSTTRRGPRPDSADRGGSAWMPVMAPVANSVPARTA